MYFYSLSLHISHIILQYSLGMIALKEYTVLEEARTFIWLLYHWILGGGRPPPPPPGGILRGW
jgi:hypothetical protein